MLIWRVLISIVRWEDQDPKWNETPSQPEVLNREMELAELALLHNLH